jgi:hypothetical protein
MVRGFEILAAMRKLDEQDGPGPHRLRDIVALTRLPQETVCRLLRQGQTQYGLFTRPQYGHYAIAEVARRPEAQPTVPAARFREPVQQLAQQTGAAALVYGATTHGPDRLRKLLAHDFGRFVISVTQAARSQQDAVVSAPLTVDAAGFAILGPRHSARHGGVAAAHWSGDGTTVWTPAPVTGLDMIAAPLWNGRDVAGSLALLTSHHQTPYERAAAARALAAEAARLSRLAVRHDHQVGLLAS